MSVTTASAHPRRRITGRSVSGVFAHAYIWIWLVIFAMPFLTTLAYSLEEEGGEGYSLAAYDYVFGTFKDNLVVSLQTTVLTIVINLLIAIPAAYAIVRFAVPGKRFLLSTLNLSLYTPAAVMGISLLIAYNYFFHMPHTKQGLVAAYVVGSYPLMLLPIIVALRDLPVMFEEASRTLGANRLQTFLRVELPLLGPGISAGILLTFVIIFNEFLVTLFIAGPNTTRRPRFGSTT